MEYVQWSHFRNYKKKHFLFERKNEDDIHPTVLWLPMSCRKGFFTKIEPENSEIGRRHIAILEYI